MVRHCSSQIFTKKISFRGVPLSLRKKIWISLCGISFVVLCVNPEMVWAGLLATAFSIYHFGHSLALGGWALLQQTYQKKLP